MVEISTGILKVSISHVPHFIINMPITFVYHNLATRKLDDPVQGRHDC
jgi:hypothetical protein